MTEQFPTDARQVARSQNEDGSWNFAQVDISEVSFKGRFGVLAGSFSSNTISIGIKSFALIEAPDPEIRVGDDVQITALADTRVFIWGEVIGTSTNSEGGTVLSVFADDLSSVGTGETYDFWEIQVVARPKPGIEKDTSTTSVDPTGAGPFTFTVTASKFFPLGGTLLIKPTTDRTIALLGKVKSYSSTSLVVEKTTTNATVSTSYTSWSIALLDAPTTALTPSEQHGLAIDYVDNSPSTFYVWPGRIRDYTDTVDLVLDSRIEKSIASDFSHGDQNGAHVKVTGTGTISSAGTTVTGTGSNLSTLFGSNLFSAPYGWGFYDYGTTILPLANLVTSSSSALVNPVITIDTASASVVSSLSETTATTNTDLGASGDTYYRGGWANGGAGVPTLPTDTETIFYGVVLIRRDSDGAIDCCLSSANQDYVPDLPAGYTYYRVIGVIGVRRDAGQTNLPDLYSIYQRTTVQEEGLYGNPLTYAAPPRGIAIDSSLDFTSALTSDGYGLTYTLQRSALTGDVTASAGSNATTIANDAVTNAKLDNMAAYTLKGRNAGTSGDPSDIDISALTEKTSLADADLFLIQDSAASNEFKKVQKSNISSASWPPGTFDLFLAASL